MQEQKRTIEAIVKAIGEMDLEPIKFKLMDKEEGQGWSRAEADRHEQEYRRFLILLAKYPGQAIVPNKNVDKFWHAHILDTMKYAEDCQQVFGYFLHHFPYFGMRGKEDAEQLARAAKQTNLLYQQEFGSTDAMGESKVFCSAPSASFCSAPGAHASFCAAPSMNHDPAMAAPNFDFKTRPQFNQLNA